jgi:putative peptidoglycan lipid II flippase
MLFGVSGVLSSILNAHQHFALPALAPLALDVGYVMGLYLLVPELGIVGLAWGTVIGAVLHILVQTPALIKYKFRYRPTLAVQLSGVREIVRLMGPRLVTLGAIQIADLFIIRLASGLAEGSTSGYFYGYALMQFPETLFGTAIAIVMFPTMAELFNSGQIEQMKHTAVSALRIIWFLTIPTAALLVLLGQPVITVLLQGNAFDADATQLVYSVLLVFSIRLVSEATVEIVARLLYAQHNTRTPMFAYLVWLAVNVSLAYLLVGRWGVVGLAAASTVAFTVLAGLLYWLNGRKLGALGGRELSATAVRAFIATVMMTAVILLLQTLELSTLPFLVIAGSAGAATYLLLYTLLGGQEIFTLLRLIKQ